MTKRKPAEIVPKPTHAPDYIIGLITLAIGIALYCFWAFPFRAALSYREQLQLFQTTGSYLCNLASYPGGLATYIGEFLTQFFNNYWIGAAAISILFILPIILYYRIIRIFNSSSPKFTAYLLALIPSASLWLFFGNPNVTLSFITASVIVIAGCYLFISLNRQLRTSGSYLLTIIMTSLSYWIAGPITIIFTLLTSSYICSRTKTTSLDKIIFPLISLIWLGINIFVWSLKVTFPLSYQLIGIGYLMTPAILESGQIMVEALFVIVPLISLLLTGIRQKITTPLLLIAEIICVVILFPKAYDSATYRLIDYDYMVRTNNWDDIISYSNRHDPDLPLSVSATNLALGMKGELDSRAFGYFQHGTEGLIPPFAKETLSSWTTGEIFFQLGMINSAQRFYFEGMEAIPNYNKSSRAIRRLAETAMIRGEYAIAEKYLHLLENTLFYKKWAQRNLSLIKDPKGVENHPLYGRLRNRMVDEEYMFSDPEIDKTLGQLFLKDPGNILARQYLIVYPLLQRNLDKFMQYMGVVAEKDKNYNPLLAQQALAFLSMKNGSPLPKGVVSPAVEQSLREFAKAWTTKNQENINPYRHTLFHYLLSNE